MAVVGIDACAQGWVAVVLEDGAAPQAHLLATIGALVEVVPSAAMIGIDIPIGLPVDGPRQSDLAARAVLGARRSSVFITPVRAALAAPTHAEATSIAVARTGAGMSQQAYRLGPKILQVAAWLPTAPCRVHEVHPEVCFAEMLGRPASAPKKTWHGMLERRDALAAQGIDLGGVDPVVGARVGVDDMLDAGAAAWTARRLLAGAARPLPDPPERGENGQSMAICV